MRRKAVLIAAALTASVMGAFAGVDLGRASRPVGCEAESGRALTPDAAARHGGGIPAVVGDARLDRRGRGGRRETFLPRVAGPEVVRDVTLRAGTGIAFVLDRRGPDDVVMETARHELRLAQPGEASDPSWSSDGRLVWSLGSHLRLWSPATSSTRRHRASSWGDRRLLARVRDGRRRRLGSRRARAGLHANRGRGPRQPLALRSAFSPLVARHRAPRQRERWVAITDADRAGRRLDRVRTGEGTGDRDQDARVRALAVAHRRRRLEGARAPQGDVPRRSARTDVASGTSTTRRAGSGGSTRRLRRPGWWTSGAARPWSTLARSRTRT